MRSGSPLAISQAIFLTPCAPMHIYCNRHICLGGVQLKSKNACSILADEARSCYCWRSEVAVVVLAGDHGEMRCLEPARRRCAAGRLGMSCWSSPRRPAQPRCLWTSCRRGLRCCQEVGATSAAAAGDAGGWGRAAAATGGAAPEGWGRAAGVAWLDSG